MGAPSHRYGVVPLALLTLALTACGVSSSARTEEPAAAASSAGSPVAATSLATAATASSTTASASPVLEASISDPAADLDGPGATHPFAANADIVGVEARYVADDERVTVRIELVDVRPLVDGADRYGHTITLSDLAAGRMVHVRRDPWRGDTVTIQTPAGLSHYGAKQESCTDATVDVDQGAAVVVLSLPAVCVSPERKPVLLTVSTGAQQVYRDRAGDPLATDTVVLTSPIRTR